jgi:dTDP-4-dehydrorhamnose 3,5-epimerase
LIKPNIFTDERGKFIKDFSLEEFNTLNIKHDMKEVFYTYSKKGVIRGLHFQRVVEQPKLVRCIKGKIFDVVIDIRKTSKNFGKIYTTILDDKNNLSLLIPKGFAHGYLVLEDSIVSYKCSEKFIGEYDDGIVWNDLTLNIPWPIDLVQDIILSEKNKKLQTFEKFSKR